MGQLSFFQATYAGSRAIINSRTASGEDSSAATNMLTRPQQQQQRRYRRPNINSTSSKAILLISAFVLLYTSAMAAAQELTTCNCSPSQYIFNLNLKDGDCPSPRDSVLPEQADKVFGTVGGVQQYTCGVQGRPVKVTEAQFIPSDVNFNAIASFTQTMKNLNLSTGDTLTFKSPTTSNAQIVKQITLKLVGIDEKNNVAESVWTIQFTNKCGVLPLNEGTDFGLVTFESLTDPSQEVCPRVNPPTPYGPSYPPRVFDKSGKGAPTRHSGSKSGKNLNSKYDGHDGYGDSKSGKSKSGKSEGGYFKGSKSRRVLRAAISDEADRESHPDMESRPAMTVKKQGQGMSTEGHINQGLRLRRLTVIHG